MHHMSWLYRMAAHSWRRVTCTYSYTYTHMYMYTHVYIYLHMHIYIYVHIYTHPYATCLTLATHIHKIFLLARGAHHQTHMYTYTYISPNANKFSTGATCGHRFLESYRRRWTITSGCCIVGSHCVDQNIGFMQYKTNVQTLCRRKKKTRVLGDACFIFSLLIIVIGEHNRHWPSTLSTGAETMRVPVYALDDCAFSARIPSQALNVLVRVTLLTLTLNEGELRGPRQWGRGNKGWINCVLKPVLPATPLMNRSEGSRALISGASARSWKRCWFWRNMLKMCQRLDLLCVCIYIIYVCIYVCIHEFLYTSVYVIYKRNIQAYYTYACSNIQAYYTYACICNIQAYVYICIWGGYD